MKKKSRLLALFLAALMTLSLLAACGKQEPLPIYAQRHPRRGRCQRPGRYPDPR